MTETVKFLRGNDRIQRLAQRPDLADGVARTRQQMTDADREYAIGLAALRRAAELTQVELAKRLGVTQAAVSRIEQPHDLLLSTLNTYLHAVGGNARIVVSFGNSNDVELELSRFTGPAPIPSTPARETTRRGRKTTTARTTRQPAANDRSVRTSTGPRDPKTEPTAATTRRSGHGS